MLYGLLSHLLSWTVLLAGLPSFHTSPLHPRQGDTVVVTAVVPNSTSVRVRFRDREFPMYPHGPNNSEIAKYRVLLGTSPDIRPGTHPVQVITDAGESSHSLKIARRSFPIQRLRLPESRNRLRKDPRIPEDKRAIREAFAQQTERQLWQGSFIMPVKNAIRTQYGLKRIVNGDPNYGWHRGYDIRGRAGTAIHAAANGVVMLVRKCVLEGNLVVLDHGHGVSTAYMHLSSFGIAEGQQVRRGEVIGRVGNTGISSGPHLHWGIYVNGVAVDPAFWLKQPPV